MASGSLFSGAGSMRELEESRLEAGKDYVINSVKVEEGYISPVEIENVPVFDESIFYYTGPETSISVNKKSVTVGSIVTVRSKVDFLKEYEGMIDKVNVIFTIPEDAITWIIHFLWQVRVRISLLQKTVVCR